MFIKCIFDNLEVLRCLCLTVVYKHILENMSYNKTFLFVMPLNLNSNIV